MPARHIDNTFIAILLAVTLVGMLVWTHACPVSSDDLPFSHVLPDNTEAANSWVPSGTAIETFQQAWTSVLNHRHLNGRLGDLVHIMLQPMPRWVEAVLLSLCLCLFLELLLMWQKTAGRLKPFGAALAVVLLWTAFPWYDGFQALVFQANYVPASALSTAIVLTFISGRTFGAKAAVGIAAMSFFTGWLHEAFGLSLAAYSAVSWLLTKRKRKFAAIVFIATLAGVAVNVLCGTSGRMASQIEPFAIFRNLLMHFVTETWPVSLAALACAYGYRRVSKAMKKDLLKDTLPLWGAILTSLLIGLRLAALGRVLWPALLYSVLCILYIAARFPHKAKPHLRHALMVMFVAAYGWWWVQVVKWERIVAEDVATLIAQCGPNRKGAPTVSFAKYTEQRKIPYYLLGLTKSYVENRPEAQSLARWLTLREASVLVLPKELEDKPFEQWPYIGEQKLLRGRWPMMVARDSLNLDFSLTVGPGDSNLPPLNRLMIAMKRIYTENTDSIGGYMFAERVYMPDGSVAYRYFTEPLPRTVANRPMAAFDTISPAR